MVRHFTISGGLCVKKERKKKKISGVFGANKLTTQAQCLHYSGDCMWSREALF